MHDTSIIARAAAILLLASILTACPGMVQPPAASHAGTPAPAPEAEAEPPAPAQERAPAPAQDDIETGQAAYYADRYHGRKTASGERYDKNALTAAHRTLPFGTLVEVKNLSNGRTVEVRINDRGPFGRKTRIIDVSRAAARALDMERAGVVPVELRIVRRPAAAGPAQAR